MPARWFGHQYLHRPHCVAYLRTCFAPPAGLAASVISLHSFLSWGRSRIIFQSCVHFTPFWPIALKWFCYEKSNVASLREPKPRWHGTLLSGVPGKSAHSHHVPPRGPRLPASLILIHFVFPQLILFPLDHRYLFDWVSTLSPLSVDRMLAPQIFVRSLPIPFLSDSLILMNSPQWLLTHEFCILDCHPHFRNLV